MGAADVVLALLFPSRCLGCRRGGPSLCSPCTRQSLALPRIEGCAIPDIGPAAALVRRAKSTGARRAAQVMVEITEQRSANGLAHVPDCDLVSWVPHDPERGARRGYHLPQLYAQRLARSRALPCAPSLCALPGTRQRGSSRDVRMQNVRGRFAALGNGAPLAGRRVLLVDDVRTTGATLQAAGAPLQDLGADVASFAFAGVVRLHAGALRETFCEE